MARRPVREGTDPSRSNRDKIIEALLALLAEKRFEEIGLADIAARAGLTLAEIRREFRSTLAILAAHMKQTDEAVLAGADPGMAEEAPRERLFDVLMRRIELLGPHKAAVRSLARSASCNAGLALALNGLTVRSMQWMLAAADIRSSGPKGCVRAQGMALLYASVLRTWFRDDEEGLPRTMAALDRALDSGARWSGFLDDLCRMVPPRCPRMPWRRRSRYREDEEPIPA